MTTPKNCFLTTLEFEEPQTIPHSDVIFDIAPEAFGIEYPSEEELACAEGKTLHRLIDKLVEIYTLTVETYDWAAIYVWRPWGGPLVPPVIGELKKAVGNKALVGGFVGNATWSLESVTDYTQFAMDLYNRPEFLKSEAQKMAEAGIAKGRAQIEAGADIVYIPNDWAYNQGLFFSRSHFEDLVMPYLCMIVEEFKRLGAVVVVHTDGYIMDILDLITASGAHMLQSIDPLAGMDIAEVKKLTYGKIALQGNVNAALLQEGTKDQIRESARYCLENASAGGGYVFSSSNTIYKGAKLEQYHEMLEVYYEFNSKTNE